MSTKTLTGTYLSGYQFQAPITAVTVATTGYVAGNGLYAEGAGAYQVINLGRVDATKTGVHGIFVDGGSTVRNGDNIHTAAVAAGYEDGVGIGLGVGGTVENYGAILATATSSFSAGVYERNGGAVVNGSNADAFAVIKGNYGVWAPDAAASVTNFGLILSTGDANKPAIFLQQGGGVTNGDVLDITALISGGYGVRIEYAAGSVTNFATISGATAGVALGAGGAVSNGTLIDTAALIDGGTGVYVDGAGSVVNLGAIVGTSSSASAAGVVLGVGTIVNGAESDRTAQIRGYEAGAWSLYGALTVFNYGAVAGLTTDGVDLSHGGVLTNGSGADREALVTGGSTGATSTGGDISNYGTIRGVAFGVAAQGGAVRNGAVNDLDAMIEGGAGLKVTGGATVSNYGAVVGLGGAYGEGLYMISGSSFTNGSAKDPHALVTGYQGVVAELGGNTFTNFGTVEGANGIAVQFKAGGDTLAVEAGSVFLGQVLGGGGTLELASGTGTLTGLLAGGNVTVSGSMPKTTFSGFGTVRVDSGATFTLAGGGKIAAGESLIDAGTLGGTGTLAIAGGSATFDAGARLSIARVTAASGATVTAAASLSYAGKWIQGGGILSVSSGATATFTGAADSFAGTLTGAGTVAFTAGSDTLSATTLSAASVNLTGAAVTLAGAIANNSAVTINGASVTIASAGATLSGAGTVSLSNSPANVITGAAAASTLTVGQTLKGAGKLGAGQMTLVTTSSGLIESTTATSLIIDTGANTISNAGKILSAGAGGTMVMSAINNTGQLFASAGVLTLIGAVTGAGTGRVSAGTLKAGSSFSEKVVFAANATGALELAHGQTYAGTLSGFSLTGKTTLDLDDILFISGTTRATFAGTAAGGTLTVTDGAHIAKIHLSGDYTASTWTLSSDGHGGTDIVDPAKPPIAQSSHGFIQAAAGLLGPAVAGEWRVERPNANACPLMAAPRVSPA